MANDGVTHLSIYFIGEKEEEQIIEIREATYKITSGNKDAFLFNFK